MFYGGLAPSLKVKTPKALKGGRGEGVNEGHKDQLRSIALCALSPCYLGLIPSGPPTARRPYSYFMFMGEKQGAGLLDPHAAEAERRVPARPGGEAHGGNIELSSRIGGGQPLHGDAAAGGKRLENSSLKRR